MPLSFVLRMLFSPQIIYNADMKFAGLVPDSLPLIDNYILENYTKKDTNRKIRNTGSEIGLLI